MMRKWLAVLRQSLSVLTAPADGPPHKFARFDIGFCRGCKRLRSVASPCCTHCGSTRPVSADA